jgi:hypothetical protein
LERLQRARPSARLLTMFVTDGRTNYDRVFDELLQEFWEDKPGNRPTRITFFGKSCVVRQEGIFAGSRKIDTIGGILILRYLLHSPGEGITGEWVPYRDFRDGANFASYTKTNIEDVIAREFAGRKATLADRLEAIGGAAHTFESNPDLSMIVYAFPSIPILSVFWDQDEEFPPSFQFLFDRSAPTFLDMESLAVLLHYVHRKLAIVTA